MMKKIIKLEITVIIRENVETQDIVSVIQDKKHQKKF